MEPVRIGLIGCGRIASRVHLRALQGLRQGRLVAIADPDPARRAEAGRAAPGISMFESHDDLLASAVDAVVICTPPATHAPCAIAALAAGKHVYVEKPLAHRLDEAKRLTAMAEASDSVAAVGLNFRLHPLIVEAKQRLREGRLGPITAVRTLFTARARALPEWKRRPEIGGGALLDLFSHHADLVPFLLGQRVEAVAADLRSVRSEDDTASVMLRLADGTLVQTLVGMAGIEADRIEVIGAEGGLLWDRHWRGRLISLEASRAAGGRARLQRAIGGLRAAAAVLRDAALPPVETSFRLALQGWLQAIVEGASPPVPLRAGLDSLRLVAAAESAAREARGSSRQSRPRRRRRPDMLASLVIPVYQAARYLPRTAPSWLNQELDGDFEVLLIDNGSTDGGVDALPDHPRLRRLHEPRRSAYAARNTGVREAGGAFLVFIDPDCLAPPGWLRRLLAPLRRDGAIAAAQGPAQPTGSDRHLRLLGLYERHREALVYRNPDPRLYYAHTNNLAVRRSAFDRYGPFDLRARGADTLLARRIVDALGCAAMVHAPDAPVEHLEVDRWVVWMRKTYLYGRHRHAGADDVRSLDLAERLSVWQSATRAEGLSAPAAAEMLALLALGCGCWWAGCAAGTLDRRMNVFRGRGATSSTASHT